jgi:hypothetical protein
MGDPLVSAAFLFFGFIALRLVAVGVGMLRDPDFYEHRRQIERERTARRERSVFIDIRTNTWKQP